MVTYWHGQATFPRNGLCQETCRDLGHVQLGMAALVNVAETAYHQGIDLYAEAAERNVSGAELHASLILTESPPQRQPPPPWLCGGRMRNSNGSTG